MAGSWLGWFVIGGLSTSPSSVLQQQHWRDAKLLHTSATTIKHTIHRTSALSTNKPVQSHEGRDSPTAAPERQQAHPSTSPNKRHRTTHESAATPRAHIHRVSATDMIKLQGLYRFRCGEINYFSGLQRVPRGMTTKGGIHQRHGTLDIRGGARRWVSFGL